MNFLNRITPGLTIEKEIKGTLPDNIQSENLLVKRIPPLCRGHAIKDKEAHHPRVDRPNSHYLGSRQFRSLFTEA